MSHYSIVRKASSLVQLIQQDINRYTALQATARQLSDNRLLCRYADLCSTLNDARALVAYSLLFDGHDQLIKTATTICRSVLNVGCSIPYGTTALMFAVLIGDLQACNIIMQNKSYEYLHAKNANGVTVWSIAIKDSDVYELLVSFHNELYSATKKY